jgi:hypothetical protein
MGDVLESFVWSSMDHSKDNLKINYKFNYVICFLITISFSYELS